MLNPTLFNNVLLSISGCSRRGEMGKSCPHTQLPFTSLLPGLLLTSCISAPPPPLFNSVVPSCICLLSTAFCAIVFIFGMNNWENCLWSTIGKHAPHSNNHLLCWSRDDLHSAVCCDLHAMKAVGGRGGFASAAPGAAICSLSRSLWVQISAQRHCI